MRHLAKLEEIKIRGEQEELAAERDELAKILGSKARLKTLVKKELAADAERYGDERRTRIVARQAAQAMDESALVSSEPVTVVLSGHGWARSAKGHEIDPEQLNYKAGDGYLASARCRSNQTAVFLDSTGRAYSVPAHTLPSARGQGEPLSGRFNPPDGASFAGVLAGQPDDRWLLATSAGYGFIAKLSDLYSRNRSGKLVLRVPAGAGVLVPSPVPEDEGAQVVAVTDTGRLLCFPASELPMLARGKGNKIVGIPAARFTVGAESMIAALAVAGDGRVLLASGKRTMTLKPRDLEHYLGGRGRRGALLPRGWRKVDGLTTG